MIDHPDAIASTHLNGSASGFGHPHCTQIRTRIPCWRLAVVEAQLPGGWTRIGLRKIGESALLPRSPAAAGRQPPP